MSITYEINKELNGIEIKFSEKPTPKVLAKMKQLGFRWNPKKFVWYAKNTEERLAFANSIKDENTYEQITLFEMPEKEKTEPKAEPKKEPKRATIKAKATKTTKTETKAVEKAENKVREPKKDNIVKFCAKERPDVKVRMAFDENATIEDCIEKINAEKNIFKDSDSLYVLDSILEMCKVNPNFRNNFMRENKTFSGAFSYFMNLAKQGYAHTFNGVAYMDNDLALGFAMDYYNMVD